MMSIVYNSVKDEIKAAAIFAIKDYSKPSMLNGIKRLISENPDYGYNDVIGHYIDLVCRYAEERLTDETFMYKRYLSSLMTDIMYMPMFFDVGMLVNYEDYAYAADSILNASIRTACALPDNLDQYSTALSESSETVKHYILDRLNSSEERIDRFFYVDRSDRISLIKEKAAMKPLNQIKTFVFIINGRTYEVNMNGDMFRDTTSPEVIAHRVITELGFTI